MNSSQNKSSSPKAAEPSRPADPAGSTDDGLSAPPLSAVAASRADESGVEPDESIVIEDFVRKDKEVADENAS